MNYYEHHLGDYLRDTAHLSMLEDGAYRRMLDVYYVKELPLPAEPRDVFRLVRANSKPERDAVQIVLREFFVLAADGWRHKRCDMEIARFQDKQAKAKRSAETRWSAHRSQSEGNANASVDAHADDMRTHSEGNAPRARPQSPVTSNHTPLTPKGVGFAEFWKIWPDSPRKVAKAECEKRWKARGLEDESDAILASVEALKATDQWQRGYEPSPLTYLNQRRWEDAEDASDQHAGSHANVV